MSKTATELQRLRDELQIAELKARCAAVDALTEDIAMGREVIAYKMKETATLATATEAAIKSLNAYGIASHRLGTSWRMTRSRRTQGKPNPPAPAPA